MKAQVKETAKKMASMGLPLVLAAVILVTGFGGLVFLRSLKQEPAAAEPGEPVLRVEAMPVEPEDVPVLISGFGTVKSLHEVPVAPEVAGVVTEIHPRLDMGETIPEGALLFQIDPRNYRNALDQAEAAVAQASSQIDRLRQQFAQDEERLKTLERSRDLARDQFLRVKELYETEDVGTRSAVEQAEVNYNQARDATDQLRQAVTLYPTRIREAESGLAAARAQRDLAAVNLERTEVRAPFEARLKLVEVKAGQYVAPGHPVLVLADDSILELSVPLDSRDMRQWLRFDARAPESALGWFGEVTSVPCRIFWTEAEGHEGWTGTLHRVERFDQTTRTVTVAVRVAGAEAAGVAAGLPLVEGMFCRVEIPGKAMEGVYRLPRWAVTFEGKVYLAQGDRLKVEHVEVLRNQGDDAFVRGLSPGDHVIVTRLVNPLPNTRLEIVAATREDTVAEQVL